MARYIETYKSVFRKVYGYDETHKCKNCRYCRQYQMSGRRVYKCEKLGVTNSVATDIRLKDTACRLWEDDNAEVH